jgi:hypothetical protein
MGTGGFTNISALPVTRRRRRHRTSILILLWGSLFFDFKILMEKEKTAK